MGLVLNVLAFIGVLALICLSLYLVYMGLILWAFYDAKRKENKNAKKWRKIEAQKLEKESILRNER